MFFPPSWCSKTPSFIVYFLFRKLQVNLLGLLAKSSLSFPLPENFCQKTWKNLFRQMINLEKYSFSINNSFKAQFLSWTRKKIYRWKNPGASVISRYNPRVISPRLSLTPYPLLSHCPTPEALHKYLTLVTHSGQKMCIWRILANLPFL